MASGRGEEDSPCHDDGSEIAQSRSSARSGTQTECWRSGRPLSSDPPAAENGHLECVKVLLEKGADVDAVNKYGRTPLHVAAFQGHLESVKLLLAANANPNAADKYGITPLHATAFKGHVEIVKMLLAAGANVNAAKEDGWTPLLVAAHNGHVECVMMLIGSGANPFVKDEEGDTALDLAKQISNPDDRKKMIRMLALKGLEGNLGCPICLDEKPKAEIAVLPCGHYICSECLQELQGLTCPLCRQHFRYEDAYLSDVE